MAKMPFDLKKFQHVKSDDKSTTLQHSDGHILTIAHKALSPEFQEQLQALSKSKNKNYDEGGEVEEDQPEPPQVEVAAPDVSSEIKGGQAGTYEAKPENQVYGPPKKEGGGGLGKLLALSDGGKVYMADGGKPKEAHWDQFHTVTYNADNAPNQAVTVSHKQSPEERDSAEVNRRQQASEEEARGKAAGLYAEGGDVADPEQVRSESPGYQQPFESVKEVPVEVQPNPYAEMYNKIYAQDRKLNPGQPDDFSRQHALNVVESQQAADKANTKIASEDAQDSQNKVIQENQRRQALGLEPMPLPAVPQLPSSPTQIQQGASLDQAPMAAKPDMPRNPAQEMQLDAREPESMMESGYQNRLAGINAQANAQGALGQQQAELLNKNIEAQREAQLSFKNSYQELENERQAHMQDIKDGYIDPNQYWKGTYNPQTGKNEGGHSKIMSGIGMILGGFNPTNSPNAAVNFLKFQMEQNLEAQKQNLGAKQNMLNANLRQFGNLRDAMDMTRVMQNDIMAHELQSAAAKAQSPMAKAAAMQAAGQLQMESAPLFQNFAMRRAMMNMSQQGANPSAIDHMLGYMRVVNPEMAKEMQSRYVPGVGLAHVPVPEKVRGDIVAKEQLSKAMSDLQMWAQKHSGSLSPSSINEGRTMAANVQNLYRDAINGGVFKQGEQAFINSIIDSDPTKFFNSIRVLPKLQEAQRENAASLNILKKNYGLPVQETQQPQYKIDKNGVKWMRGPKGQAIRVK